MSSASAANPTASAAVSDIFGAPRTGVHALRIADVAVVDLALTLVAGYAIARGFALSFALVTIVLLLLSVCVHAALRVDTTFTRAARGLFSRDSAKNQNSRLV